MNLHNYHARRKRAKKYSRSSYPTKEKWMKTMKEELKSMRSNNVCDLVDLLEGHKVIKNK
jgi:hypothetical protein